MKDRIQNQYSGEKLEQEMQTLDNIYTKAKEEIANSYAENIGGFYESLGQSGVAEDMRESIIAAIDNKVNEYTSYLKKNDIYAGITEPNKQWLKQDDGYMAARLREYVTSSSVDKSTTHNISSNDKALYSAKDLAFSVIYVFSKLNYLLILTIMLFHNCNVNTDKQFKYSHLLLFLTN